MSPPPVSRRPWRSPASWRIDAEESCGGSATGTPPACCTAWRYAEFTYARSGLAPTVMEVLTPMSGARRLMRPCYHRHAGSEPGSYTHLRAHETPEHLVCRL